MLIRPHHLQDMVVIGDDLLSSQNSVIRRRMGITDERDIISKVSCSAAGRINTNLRLTSGYDKMRNAAYFHLLLQGSAIECVCFGFAYHHVSCLRCDGRVNLPPW